MKLYSIYDNKVGTYAPPFAVAHEMLALRAFINLAKDTNSQISQHPSDFNLMYLGSFNADTGGFTPLPAPTNMGTASSFLQNKAEG